MRCSPVGLYWFDGYRPTHSGVGAQQEWIHSVAYFMIDIKSLSWRRLIWCRSELLRTANRGVSSAPFNPLVLGFRSLVFDVLLGFLGFRELFPSFQSLTSVPEYPCSLISLPLVLV
ncbi:hypothetical protein CLU79DRAFT_840449 [Phycomyces nitens]|nr:hypothetical protein CLU79DRAFT_840449 [Phycomyces nitens]